MNQELKIKKILQALENVSRLTTVDFIWARNRSDVIRCASIASDFIIEQNEKIKELEESNKLWRTVWRESNEQ